VNAIQTILETVNTVRDRIAAGATAFAVLDAIRPLLIEFSMSPEVLTDDRRADLQARVHAALRDARLVEGVDL
jgi:hypothetical protein